MKRLLVIAPLLLVSQLAAAKVYMCVDQATGETSFTDKACETASAREEVRLNAINPGSGNRNSGRQKAGPTWRSQEDVRKTGSDYNADRRSLYENKATAANN